MRFNLNKSDFRSYCQTLFYFFLGCIAILSTALWMRNNYIYYYFDADEYWSYGQKLIANHFYLGSIDGFRGYVYPFFIGMASFVGSLNGWTLWNTFLQAVLIFWIIPRIFDTRPIQKAIPKSTLIAALICIIVICVLFYGLFGTVLSDCFAILLCSCAVFMAARSLEENKPLKCFLYSIFTGIFVYFCYNVRTIYLFFGIGLFFVFWAILLYDWRINKSVCGYRSILCYLPGQICGIILAGIPQGIMNKINLGQFSISVPTNSLMISQVGWGFFLQRYDTYVPFLDDALHPSAQMFFIDSTGVKLLSELGWDGDVYAAVDSMVPQLSSWKSILSLIISHPLSVCSIYLRHFVNYVFCGWPEVYIANMTHVKWGIVFLGFTVLFAFGLVCIFGAIRKIRPFIFLLPMLIPAILIVPGAVENRFSYPLYFFALINLCFNTNWETVKKKLRDHGWVVILCYLVLAAFCISIWTGMLASESVTPILF